MRRRPRSRSGCCSACWSRWTLADATRNRKALQRVLQREREESARVAGELQAARRIQLDTLPRAEKLRDPRIELAASMEPAQEVGGDLYDFYLLDEHRLFFMLGDVSGKGLSASIFMAVSKALCKSTMLRSTGADLGALLSQANLEVERDNPGALFVTVFAGVLDLRSGRARLLQRGAGKPVAGSSGWRRGRALDGRRRAAALRRRRLRLSRRAHAVAARRSAVHRQRRRHRSARPQRRACTERRAWMRCLRMSIRRLARSRRSATT